MEKRVEDVEILDGGGNKIFVYISKILVYG
jgi:hypothetical protein